MNDSIRISSYVKEQISAADGGSTSLNIWMCIAIIEFAIIFYLILSSKINKQSSSRNILKNEVLSQEVDFNNLINSSFNAQALYDALKVKCHPDRFADNQVKFDLATSIFQEITKNKNNLKRLEELKEEAIKNLNIKI